MDYNINITGITERQSDILDQIWMCKTEDELFELRMALEPDEQLEMELLIESIVLACLDSEIESETDCVEARNALNALRGM